MFIGLHLPVTVISVFVWTYMANKTNSDSEHKDSILSTKKYVFHLFLSFGWKLESPKWLCAIMYVRACVLEETHSW